MLWLTVFFISNYLVLLSRTDGWKFSFRNVFSYDVHIRVLVQQQGIVCHYGNYYCHFYSPRLWIVFIWDWFTWQLFSGFSNSLVLLTEHLFAVLPKTEYWVLLLSALECTEQRGDWAVSNCHVLWMGYIDVLKLLLASGVADGRQYGGGTRWFHVMDIFLGKTDTSLPNCTVSLPRNPYGVIKTSLQCCFSCMWILTKPGELVIRLGFEPCTSCAWGDAVLLGIRAYWRHRSCS